MCVTLLTALPSLGAHNESEEFECGRWGDFITVPVTIGDTELQFLLDTGSEITVVDQTMQHLLIPTESKKKLSDGYKSVSVKTFKLPSQTRIGKSVPIGDVPFVLAHDFRRPRDAFGVEFDGILGCDSLQDKCVQIDFDKGVVRFLNSVDRGDTGLGAEVPLGRNKKGSPTIPMRIGAGRPIPFVIDTGAIAVSIQIDNPLYLSLEKRGNLETVGESEIMRANGNTVERKGQLESARLGPYRPRNVKIGTGPFPFGGLDFLSRFMVTLDLRNDRAFLLPGSRISRGPDRNVTGAEFSRVRGKFFIHQVEDGSIAAQAGLKPRDQVSRVNGIATSHISSISMRRNMSLANGALKLTVHRANTPLDVTIPVRTEQRQD